MSTFYGEIANGILKIVGVIIGIVFTTVIVPWLKSVFIPWTKEKKIYSLVQRFVHAAEKIGETMDMSGKEKKQYVISLLEANGYVLNPEIDAFIESAVKEMDMLMDGYMGEILNAFEDETVVDANADEVDG